MKDWKKILVSPESPIFDAIKIIDKGSLQIALVVDDEQRLVGTVTDGDIRQGILLRKAFNEPVGEIMCKNPIIAHIKDSTNTILYKMKQADVMQVPVIDEDGCVADLKILKDLVNPPIKENPVVLMVGGFGIRLRPLTLDCPKPLLEVGEKPILETILENFIANGFRNFFFSVNYKAQMIETHFGDGSKWGGKIEYLHEAEPMGTAGALSLLLERPRTPFFVMNGDLLTNINFNHLLNFHTEHGATASMCVNEFDFQVPYGVVATNEYRFVGVDEKPVHKFFVNAGIYVLNPDVLDYIPKNTFIDMTTVFEEITHRGDKAIVFPVREKWLDIGSSEDFLRANNEHVETLSFSEKD